MFSSKSFIVPDLTFKSLRAYILRTFELLTSKRLLVMSTDPKLYHDLYAILVKASFPAQKAPPETRLGNLLLMTVPSLHWHAGKAWERSP